MKKLNWDKLPQRVAVKAGTLWHGSTCNAASLKCSVQPEQVEELFSRQEISHKKAGDQKQEDGKPKKAEVVCCLKLPTSTS